MSYVCLMRTTLVLAVVAVSLTLGDSINAFVCQQDDWDLQVGDVIEFELLNELVQGTVTGFVEGPSGWPFVDCVWRNREQNRMVATSQIKRIVSRAGVAVPEAEMRTWQDSTGRFKVEARILSSKGGQIELEKKDGRVVKLPISRLSDADKKFVAEWEMENSDENPFAGGESPSPSTGAKDRAAFKAFKGTKPGTGIKPDPGTREIMLRANGWNVVPDSADSSNHVFSDILLASVKEDRYDFHNKYSGIQTSSNKRFLAYAVGNSFRDNSLVVCTDLQNGEVQRHFSVNRKQVTLLGISNDGTLAVTMTPSKGGNPGKVDFWRHGDSESPSLSWGTAGFRDRDGFRPKSGVLLDDKRLLTIEPKRMTLWDIESAAAVYSVSLDQNSSTAFSPNRKQIAITLGDSVFIVDTSDGQVLGKFVPEFKPAQLAFSPSGRLLAGSGGPANSAWIWDLKDNVQRQELTGTSTFGKPLHWVGEKYLLFNDRDLVDLRLRLPVWRFQPEIRSQLVSANDGRFWLLSKNRIVPVDLLPEKLEELAAKHKPEDLLILKPGDQVSLGNFDVPYSNSEKDEIRAHLKKMLTNNGLKVVDNGGFTLSGSVTKGKRRTINVSDFIPGPFGRRGGERVTYTPHTSAIRLERNGKTVWQKTGFHGPLGIITPRRGESTQSAVNRISKPNLRFFTRLVIPKDLAQLPDGKPFGTSRLTSSGVR